ncbi:hypothetical protein HID58_033455 [Brassica napus]|uniref:Uncharacterized protein n=1 Tax=Brassica napus TaxID=3708 RepID=A0ABQ8BZ88_BRANA|nr:hypothetical protein HID58_033455 [Brassica napus]
MFISCALVIGSGKLKVASSDRVSNASTNSAAGVKPEKTDSRKEFRGGRSAGGRQESRLFCTDSETETDLLLAVPVSNRRCKLVIRGERISFASWRHRLALDATNVENACFHGSSHSDLLHVSKKVMEAASESANVLSKGDK